MRKVLGIYDIESGYGERLAGYLSAKGKLPFRVVVFTSEEILCGFSEKEELHILLLHEKYMSEKIAGLSIAKILLLTEEPEAPGGENQFQKEVQSVYKYQSAEAILQKIMDCYDALLPVAYGEEKARDGAGLITVYSPVHHCFKTTFALLYGQMLAKEERVLFVSLEVCAGFETLFELAVGADLSDAFYYYRQGKLAEQLPGIVQHLGELDVLMPVQYPEDLHEIHVEELLEMLCCILQEGLYSAIVLDAGEALYRPADILKRSRRIFMPRREDGVSLAKLQAFESCLSLWGQEDVEQRIEWLQLPCQPGPGGRKEHYEELMWGAMGDYVRGLLPGVCG